jgi:hypothetical protein
MPNPDYLTQLIEKASRNAGGQAALARMLEVPAPSVTQWKKGKPCPVGDQVLMAEIAGLKGEEWAARALVAQYEGTSKGDKLYRALKKSLPAIGAVIASGGAHASVISSTAIESVTYFIQCILC